MWISAGPERFGPARITRQSESNRANLSDRDAATIVVVRRTHHMTAGAIGAIAMRSTLSFPALAFSVLAVGLLTSFTSASAAKEHHHRPRHAVLRHAYNYDPPGFLAAPRVVVPPIIEDQTPSYNDPSKWGGGAP